MEYAYDGVSGTAGGPEFATGLRALVAERGSSPAALATAANVPPDLVASVLAGDVRISVVVLAALARGLRVKPIEFMQKCGLLSLGVYAAGLDPLFFLPSGQIRSDARIYMREINPRHAVPEGDMTKRNPFLRALADDPLLDAQGKLEIELAYLLRTAVAATGGLL